MDMFPLSLSKTNAQKNSPEITEKRQLHRPSQRFDKITKEYLDKKNDKEDRKG